MRSRRRRRAGQSLKGATAYVTLEPCSHHGRTPPCADALVTSGVARVVSALEDPDPRVKGQGHERLKAAGIAVEVGEGAAEAAEINAGFLLRVREGRPLFHLKMAGSLDGRIATASGESKWITGEAARRDGHRLRAIHDAILVGAATARGRRPGTHLSSAGARGTLAGPHRPRFAGTPVAHVETCDVGADDAGVAGVYEVRAGRSAGRAGQARRRDRRGRERQRRSDRCLGGRAGAGRTGPDACAGRRRRAGRRLLPEGGPGRRDIELPGRAGSGERTAALRSGAWNLHGSVSRPGSGWFRHGNCKATRWKPGGERTK